MQNPAFPKIVFIALFFILFNVNNALSFQDSPGDSLSISETVQVAEQENGEEHHAPHLDGSNLSLWWILPFMGILLSIAVMPLLVPHFWHHNYGKVSLFWSTLFLVMFTIFKGINMSSFYLAEVYLGEFIPFIVLLLALFTVGGGIRLKGELVGTPVLNTLLILIGTVLASWMGTTGAAMVMIRPLIRANKWRKYQKHTIIFFIFLVANIGGSLTPLGDPPLFLGFLKGVSFFWTAEYMLLPMLFCVSILLVVFYVVDTFFYKKETNIPEKKEGGEKLTPGRCIKKYILYRE